MLGGTISCIIGMNLFANAAKISFGYLPIARMVAVLAFGILDFSTNAIMFPSRALMGDLLPADQQHAVQSAAAVVASLAEICGGVYIFSWKDPVTQISQIFIVASVLMAISCGITLFVCKETALRADSVELVVMEEARNTESAAETGVGGEGGMEPSRGENEKPHATVNESEERGDVIEKENDEIDDEENALAMATREDENDAESEDHVVENVGEDEESYVGNGDQLSVWAELVTTVKATLNQFPRPLIKVGIVYGLAWFLWFASLPYYSQWLGVDVLQGDPGAEAGSPKAVLYQQGVSVFSVANVFKALLALVFSAYYPRIIKWVGAIGERVVFGMSFLVFSAVLFAFAYTKKVIVAASVIALGSVPFIVTQTIPIAIVVQRYPENLASNLGVMNLFCVVPQLVDTLYTGKVAEWAGESAVLRVAAGWGFAASLAAFCFL